MNTSKLVGNFRFFLMLSLALIFSVTACSENNKPENNLETQPLNFHPTSTDNTNIQTRHEEDDDDDDEEDDDDSQKNENEDDDDDLKNQPEPIKNTPPTFKNRLNKSLPINIAVDRNPADEIVEVDLVATQSMIEIKPGVFIQRCHSGADDSCACGRYSDC